MTTSHDGHDPTTSTAIVTTQFEGHAITALTWKGQPYVITQEIGKAIGYAAKGGRLVSKCTGEWKAELHGDRAILIEGKDLAILKAVLPTESVGSRARSIHLLTEAGLWRVLILTGKPAGIRLRDLLDTEVLPKLRATGSYTVPGAEVPPLPPKATPKAIAGPKGKAPTTALVPRPVDPAEADDWKAVWEKAAAESLAKGSGFAPSFKPIDLKEIAKENGLLTYTLQEGRFYSALAGQAGKMVLRDQVMNGQKVDFQVIPEPWYRRMRSGRDQFIDTFEVDTVNYRLLPVPVGPPPPPRPLPTSPRTVRLLRQTFDIIRKIPTVTSASLDVLEVLITDLEKHPFGAEV